MEQKATTPAKFEEKVRNATISDRTRDYFIVFGKLTDIDNEFCELIARDYGESQTDRLAEEYRNLMCKVQTEVEEHLIWSITENIFTLDCVQI